MKFRLFFKNLFCKHEKWNQDTQIKVIECINCGKRAWINDTVDLFKSKK